MATPVVSGNGVVVLQ